MESLGLFYGWRLRSKEGEATFRLASEKLAVSASGDGLRVLAKILTWQSNFSEDDFSRQLLQQSLALLQRPELAEQDTRPEKAFALMGRGGVELGSDRREARRLFEQSLALYRALDNRWGTAYALDALSLVARHLGALDEAKQLCEESLAIRRVLGDRRGIADSLQGLSRIALKQGQIEEAEQLAQESIVMCHEIGDRFGIAFGLQGLGASFYWRGKFAKAHSLLEESAALWNDLGGHGLAISNVMLVGTNAHLGRYEQACSQGQIGLDLSREMGYRLGTGLSCWWLGGMALAAEEYAEAQQLLQESIAAYQEIEQRDELGWALAALGCAARGLGQPHQARQHLYKALRTVTEIRDLRPLTLALPATALLLADQDEKELAVELYALALRDPIVANSRWFEDVAGKHIAAIAATLPPEVVAAAQERGRARDLDATVAELLVELGE
jgi:tetratricopeptide (TPR) repeat protein